MKAAFNGIRRSLAWKLFLLGVVPAFFLLLLVAFVVIWSMKDNLVRTSLQAIEAELNHAAHEVADVNDEAMQITETLVTANEAGLFGRRYEGMEISKAILEKHPQLTGVSLAYEPNADGGDEAWAKRGGLPAGSLDASGRLVLYWFRNPDKGGAVDLAPLEGMDTSYYYQGLKNRVEGRPESEGVILDGKPAAEAVSQYYDKTREMEQKIGAAMLTEPYDYQGKLIVECVAPIRKDGKFVGMIGADRALGDLENFLRTIKPFKTTVFFLVSLRGRIICATSDDTLRTKKIENTPYRDILHRFYSDGNATAIEEPDPVTKEECYFAGVHVPGSGWTLVMRVDASEVLAPINMAIRNVLVITLSVGLVIVLVFSVLFRSVLRRIHHAADTATRVAEGDLTVQVIEDNEDETGQLLKAIGRMVHDLHSVVSRVHQAGLQLSTTSDDLRAVSSKREDSVKTFGASSSEIAAAVQQISATSQELAKTMGDVTNVAGDTADLADRGRSKLAAMVDNSKELESATRSISSKLSVINEKAANINSVITTITKVADQTNLLSLNAAIEAEKAGEYGLGFSVVAREIRRLADQTAVATLDIEQMVKEMQSSVSAGVMEMDKFASAVIRGVEGSNDIASQLEQIIAQVQALTPRFETVTEGMESQSKGAQQINNAMTQLTGMAREAAMSATEFNQASQKLQSSVELLRQEVARFKLN